jgi:hypothetical protein
VESASADGVLATVAVDSTDSPALACEKKMATAATPVAKLLATNRRTLEPSNDTRMTASCAKWREERQFSDASRGGGRIMARSFAPDYQDFLASVAHKRPFMARNGDAGNLGKRCRLEKAIRRPASTPLRTLWTRQ